MKYTIGTDDRFIAGHVIILTELLEATLGFTSMEGLDSLAFILDMAGDQFQRMDKNGESKGWKSMGKDTPQFKALLDFQRALQETQAKLALILP